MCFSSKYHWELPSSYVGVGYALCLLCALLTPTANPFYYTIFNSSFKAAVYDMCPCFYKERIQGASLGWNFIQLDGFINNAISAIMH